MAKLQRAKQKRNNMARTLERLKCPNYLTHQESRENEVQSKHHFFGALKNVDIGSLQCASCTLSFLFCLKFFSFFGPLWFECFPCFLAKLQRATLLLFAALNKVVLDILESLHIVAALVFSWFCIRNKTPCSFQMQSTSASTHAVVILTKRGAVLFLESLFL